LYYALDESFRGIGFVSNYRGELSNRNTQWLTTQHLRYMLPKGYLSLNASVQESMTTLHLGALHLRRHLPMYYLSLNGQWHVLPQWRVNVGVHYRGHRLQSRDTLPPFFFDFGNSGPPQISTITAYRSAWEAHIYQSQSVLPTLKVFQGLRWHYTPRPSRFRRSHQLGIKWQITDAQLLTIQRGKYHFIQPIHTGLHPSSIEAWRSDQLALTYQLQTNMIELHLSLFRKKVYGPRFSLWDGVWYDSTDTRGFESGLHLYYAHWHVYVSLLSLRQDAKADGQQIAGVYDFPWWWRAMVTYKTRRFTLSLTAQQRPGAWLFSYSNDGYWPAEDLYLPRRSDRQQRLPHYFSLDINVSRVWLRDQAFVLAFFHVSNLTDRANILAYSYSRDYSTQRPEWLQRRTFYFGCIYQWGAL